MRLEIQRAVDQIEPPVEDFVAVDFETYYRTAKPAVSVESQGNYNYTRHEEFNAYLVSIFNKDISYVGSPKNAPWEKIKEKVWVSHNRNFDRHVYEAISEKRIVPEKPWKIWHDTADLAVYSHLPRALSKAATIAFKITLDKEARSFMDGVQWRNVPEKDQERITRYALEDAALCWMLWARYSKDWPSIERQASLHTGEIEFRGIPVDVDGIDQDITFLNTAENITRNRIPWIDTEDERGKPVALRSKKALDRECVKCGVPPPLTTAQKSKEFLDWVDEYGERVPAVIELGRYRRITRAIAIYKALKERIRKCDNRAAIGLKYGGADKTMRWSGSSKFNLQNLMKSPLMFTKDYLLTDNHNEVVNCVDIRSRFIASKGRKLIIADLSQIEPRVLNWVVGNNDFLELCRKGMSPYEAHARSSMGWVGGNLKKEDPKIYALAKARVLALGYGAGWGKFIEMARGYLASEDEFLAIFAIKPTQEAVHSFLNYLNKLSLKNHSGSKTALSIWPDLNQETQNIWVNAWSQVEHFRATNHKIKAYWNSLDSDFKRSVDTGIYECELPSKRTLKYFDVTPSHGWQCKPANPLGVVQKTYGGLLVENAIQSISRDIFCHGILKLEQAGYQVLFHVHDEVIVDATAETDPSDIIKLLTEIPEWASNLPVTAEAEITTHYKK